ncbi:MAG: hypothetical protein ACI8YQ_002910 [Polaribacter sp.]|jgi:hypothetical protein
MHDIEPFYKWRSQYVASDDERSPFHGRQYNEFSFSQKIYNYFIHPQWDDFGSSTLYMKILFVDYDKHFAIFELIGEWNDCLHNDINFLKREVADALIDQGISKFILLSENVLNFHAGDDCYYEEWWDDVKEEDGWIAIVNTLDHVKDEMEEVRLQYYVNFGNELNGLPWHNLKPKLLFELVEGILKNQVRQLG